MKNTAQSPYIINSISELHRLLVLPKPAHPMVSVIDLSAVGCITDPAMSSVVYNFYSICIKKDFKGKLKYGRNYYDFDEGVMTFFAPGQVIATELTDDTSLNGCWLVFHPDFIQSYPLAAKLKSYGFFSYAVNEALHLSEKEEAMVATLMDTIAQEYHSAIDHYSQDVIIAQIELLLNYCNRFYNRQFITRKNAGNDLLSRLEALLDEHFSNQANEVLPTVQSVAAALNVSPDYLSDMLRSLTGRNTQQHIHNRLIEEAKELLSTTSLSVSEIAYRLGFGYPQSFNKLFKSKTQVSPLAFRQSFN